jgi:glycosyltransferase involved in cell wall biosynthesis
MGRVGVLPLERVGVTTGVATGVPNTRMKRLLFLYCGPYYDPSAIPVMRKFQLLSQRYCGDILAVLTLRSLAGAQLTNFRLRGVYLPVLVRENTLLRDIAFTVAVITRAVYMHWFQHRYDVIVAPEPLVAGVVALVLRALTGAKVVVEVSGLFEDALRLDTAKPSAKARLKEAWVHAVVPRVLRRANAVKLLYPGQVKVFTEGKPLQHCYAFANFVSVSQFKEGKGAAPYILFLGYPWYLKGADLLIRAFNDVCDDFPAYTLKIVGWCPDKSEFEALARGNPRIELCDAVAYPEVVRLMSECALFVLPSRTEGIARVLSEAMASKKPIIASNVGGTPSIIRDGETGLLFESENVADLATKLRRMLADSAYATRLAESGFRYVHEELSEARYFDRFSHVIEQVTSGPTAATLTPDARQSAV